MTRFQFNAGDRPLDGYTIEYALGRGGFGEVYYAVSDAGRQVALKAVQNYEEIELRGISHCMNLKSQHLVSIFDVKHSADGAPWVIMEFVAGPSLRDILDESPRGIGPEKATFFVRELAKGLSYLHNAGVVHRDLKPHNVFFEEGVVKIGDYSLSKAITSSHRSGHTMTVGTVHYMAPEIGMGRYDKTVDIYALGVMLFEMLTGSPPYTGDSMGEVLMKHLSSTPDVSVLPEPFASVVTKAMERDPADRYQSAEEMAQAISGDTAADVSLTGFGPASLSMVADHAARRVRPASEDSTGRVDAAMTATQHDRIADDAVSVHPMRQLGRDLGRLAYYAGIIGGRIRDVVTTRPDPVAWGWRLSMATAVLMMIALAGAVAGDWVGASLTESQLSDDSVIRFSDDRSSPMTRTAQFVRILIASAMVFAGAVIVRGLNGRGILPEQPVLCRVSHAACSFALFGTFVMLFPFQERDYVHLFPVGIPLLIQNWCSLTSPLRAKRLRLCPVCFASTFAFIFAELGSTGSIMAAASVTGSALAVQFWARFDPPVDGQSDQPDAALAETMNAQAVAALPLSNHSLVAAE